MYLRLSSEFEIKASNMKTIDRFNARLEIVLKIQSNIMLDLQHDTGKDV